MPWSNAAPQLESIVQAAHGHSGWEPRHVGLIRSSHIWFMNMANASRLQSRPQVARRWCAHMAVIPAGGGSDLALGGGREAVRANHGRWEGQHALHVGLVHCEVHRAGLCTVTTPHLSGGYSRGDTHVLPHRRRRPATVNSMPATPRPSSLPPALERAYMRLTGCSFSAASSTL